jgi:Xaa-Pro aminopeptidase
MVKTDYEISLIKKAAELCDLGFQKALDTAKPGVREYELMAAIEYEMRLNGMNDQGPFLMASSPHTYMMYGSTDKKLAKGDILNFEITPSYKGYFIQICRSAIVGPISAKRTKAYEWSLKAIEAAEALMKPGVDIRELCVLQNDVLESVVSFKRYRRGHMFGHGMDLRKGCQIEMENYIKMEKNMVFTVHPNQYNPDFGYMALGCPVVITDDGIEHLSKHTHELVSIPI